MRLFLLLLWLVVFTTNLVASSSINEETIDNDDRNNEASLETSRNPGLLDSIYKGIRGRQLEAGAAVPTATATSTKTATLSPSASRYVPSTRNHFFMKFGNNNTVYSNRMRIYEWKSYNH